MISYLLLLSMHMFEEIFCQFKLRCNMSPELASIVQLDWNDRWQSNGAFVPRSLLQLFTLESIRSNPILCSVY